MIIVFVMYIQLDYHTYTVTNARPPNTFFVQAREKGTSVERSKAFHLTWFACVTHPPCIEYMRSSVKLASRVAAPATPIQAAAP